MYLLKINVVEASYSFLYIPVPSNIYQYHFRDTLTPVVQNVVSVTKSLVEDSLILTVLTKSNAVIVLPKKSCEELLQSNTILCV